MIATTRRPALAGRKFAFGFAVQLAICSSLGYTLVAWSASQPENTPYHELVHLFLVCIGPSIALLIAWFGYQHLKTRAVSSLGALTGMLLGFSNLLVEFRITTRFVTTNAR